MSPSSAGAASGWHWLALALILLAGAALRFPMLDRVPYGIFYDEAINGQDALDVWRPGGTGFRIYYADVEGFPREPMYQTIIAFTVRAFGNSVVALRATSAVLGMLSILLLYLFSRRWIGEVEALCIAGVLATLRWHVLFSRLIFRTLLLGPYFLCLVWAALAYDRRRTPARAALLGVFLGGGFYTYLSWWFLLPVAGGAVAWLFHRSIRTPQGRRHFALLALAAGLTYLPMGIFFVRHPDIILKRPGAVSIFSAGPREAAREVLKNAGEALLMFHLWGDHVAIQNVPGPSRLASLILDGHVPVDPRSGTPFIGRPALDPLQGIVFLIGLWVVVGLWRRERRPLVPLLLAWLCFGWLTTVLTRTDSPNFLRTQCLTPPVAILTGLGLSAAGHGAARRWGAWAGACLAGLALCLSAAQTAWDVYGVWGRSPEVWQRFHGDLTDLARAAAQAPEGVAVMFPGERFTHPTVQYLTFGRKNIHPYRDLPSMLGAWPPSDGAKQRPRPRKRWIIVTADNPLARVAGPLLPQGQVIREFFHPLYGGVWAWMISVPEESLPPPEKLAIRPSR